MNERETSCEQWRDGKSFRQWPPCIGSSDNKANGEVQRGLHPPSISPENTCIYIYIERESCKLSRCKWHEMALKGTSSSSSTCWTPFQPFFLSSFFSSLPRLKRNVDASSSIHRDRTISLSFSPSFVLFDFSFLGKKRNFSQMNKKYSWNLNKNIGTR